MNANEAPEKIYINSNLENRTWLIGKGDISFIEYTRTDALIEKACGWIKENITNNPNANSVLVRNGCVTLGMLIDDFINYMKEE